MSFILDALKKSEAERQRQSTPGIADLPQAAPNQAPRRWLWAVGGLLVINLAVLGGLLLQSRQAGGPAPVPSGAPSVEPAAVSVATDSAREAPGMAPPVTPQPRQVAEERPIVTTPIERNRAPETRPELAPGPRPATVADGPVSFNELRASGDLQLPDLHLDIHVYSDMAADRFVFVNMSKYKENAVLSEGPRVTEITPEGVILEFRGQEFLLPRE